MKNETNKAKAKCLAARLAKCDAIFDAASAKCNAAIAPHRAKRDATYAAAYHKIWNANVTYDLAKAPHIAAFTAAVASARARYEGATTT